MLKAVVTGDSHAYFLGLAAERIDCGDVRVGWLGPGNKLQGDFFKVTKRGVELNDPEVAANIGRIVEGAALGGHVAASWGLSMGMHAFMVLHDRMWFDYTPIGFDGPGQLLSRAVLERIFANRSQRTLDFAMALRGTGADVFMIEPPLRIDSKFLHASGKLPIRLWAEAQYRSFFTDRLADHGIPVLSPPKETLDEGGIVKPVFNSLDDADYFHCNEDYGVIVLRQVLHFLQGGNVVADAAMT